MPSKSRKRRRSESFSAEQEAAQDPRKRLAAFHARMFDAKDEGKRSAESAAKEGNAALFAAGEAVPTVQWKASSVGKKKKKGKKHKQQHAEEDDGEPVPLVKLSKTHKKAKKGAKAAATPTEAALSTKKPRTGPAVIKTPGAPSVYHAGAAVTATKSLGASNMSKHKQSEDEKKATKFKHQSAGTSSTTCSQAPQWHQAAVDKQDEVEDGVDPLEQALVSVKEMAASETSKADRKKSKATKKKLKHKQTSAPTTAESEEPSKQLEDEAKKPEQVQVAALVETGEDKVSAIVGANVTLSKGQKKKHRLKKGKNQMLGDAIAVPPKTPASAVPTTTTASPSASKTSTEVQTNVKSPPGFVKPSPPSKKAKASLKKSLMVPTPAPKSPPPPKTLLAASLDEDAKKDTDMFLPAKPSPSVKSKAAATAALVRRMPAAGVKRSYARIAEDSASESEAKVAAIATGQSEDDEDEMDKVSIFSRLIDEAAREQWELVAVGSLVRLFAAQWGFSTRKTASFLRENCPELVSVDFLEGLGVNLSGQQLVGVFDSGSGNAGVFMNKLGSAVENGHLSVRDPVVVAAVEKRVSRLETNAEVVSLLHPLLESLSTVRDVGQLLKQLCQHWQLQRTAALVQQVLLTNVFDDLDGNQDEILRDLPQLKGRLDFPSRLDQEDADENGNLVGFLADEDSDLGGDDVDESEAEEDESDSEDDEEPYDGETDSEEEVAGRPRGRSRFIEDEVDVGEESEDEERGDGDASDSEDD